MMATAPPVIWDTDMQEVVEKMAFSMPDDGVLERQDVAMPAAFHYFQKPLLISPLVLDFVDTPVRTFHAVSVATFRTNPANNRVIVFGIDTEHNRIMHVPVEQAEGVRVELFFKLPKRWAVGDRVHVDTQPALMHAVHLYADFGEKLSLLSSGVPDGFSDQELIVQRELYALVFSMYHMLNTKIAVAESRPTPRGARHSEALVKAYEEAKYVTLRRRERTATEGSADVEWSHRWLVNGHWRNQYYPSTQNNRPVWIHGYVKGPENLPLIVKPTITRVIR